MIKRFRAVSPYSLAFEMNMIVSIEKMNACMTPENQSKYTDVIAGRPTERIGIFERMLPTAPGRCLKIAADAPASAQ